MKTAPRRMFLIPAKDRLVRKYHDPARHLDPDGEYCPRTAEWIRAVRSGDVVEGKPKAKPKAKK